MWQEHLTSPFIHEAVGQVAKDPSSQDKALGPGGLAATSASPQPSAAPRDAAEHLVRAES